MCIRDSSKRWLSGDVGLLAGATALEEIDLDPPSVSGSVAPLAALSGGRAGKRERFADQGWQFVWYRGASG